MDARRRVVVAAVVGLLAWAGLAHAGLVAYYTFDNSGNLGIDSSSSGYNASNSGATYDAAGYSGGAARFPGSNEYLQLPSNSVLDNLQNLPGYTIAAWVRADQVPPGTGDQNNAHYGIIEKAGYHSGLRYTNTQTFAMDAWRAGDVGLGVGSPAGSPYPPLAWHHVLSTVDKTAGTVKIYVDGALMGTTNFTPGTNARAYGTTPWRLGIANPGSGTYRWPMDGMIDDAALWNVVLPDAFIQALGTGTAQPSNTPAPVGRLELYDHANVGTAAYAHDPVTGQVYGPVSWKIERMVNTPGCRVEWFIGNQAWSGTPTYSYVSTDAYAALAGNFPISNRGSRGGGVAPYYPDQFVALYGSNPTDIGNYSVRWSGQILIGAEQQDALGRVFFGMNGDDRNYLKIDGTTIMDWGGNNDWGTTPPYTTGTGPGNPLALSLGWHTFEYGQNEGGGGDAGRLRWWIPSLSAWADIPVDSLRVRTVGELLAYGNSNVGGPTTNGIFTGIGSSPGEQFDLRLTVDYLGSSAIYEASFAGVPEPATCLLLAGGLAALVRRRRARRP